MTLSPALLITDIEMAALGHQTIRDFENLFRDCEQDVFSVKAASDILRKKVQMAVIRHCYYCGRLSGGLPSLRIEPAGASNRAAF